MTAVLRWWMIVEVLGLATLPLAFRLFHRMPGRGYLLAKPLGLLLVSFVLWIGATFGLLNNTAGGIIVALAVAAAASAGAYWGWPGREGRQRDSLLEFLRVRWKYVLACELLFLVAFAGWAAFRSFDPDLVGTEKPMEFAFLNAILRSDRFPPHDPWMSGYAISYYYFGYLMVALLTRLSAVPAAWGFNLGIALLFSLTLTGAFSILYDLVAGSRRGDEAPRRRQAAAFGLLGAGFVAVMGNLEGLLESLHSKGLGSLQFWKWINIHGLAEAPVTSSFLPSDHWWWWRASRVIFDRTLTGQYSDVIDEFPFFSFILGDMHPHVLALPFVLLAIALIINLVRTLADAPAEEKPASMRLPGRLWRWLTDRPLESVLLALCLGGLGFLNTWDFPIYWALGTAAYLIGSGLRARRWDWRLVGGAAAWGVKILLFGLGLYLPFYLGFQSQASGLMPVLMVKTRSEQYLVMFGLLTVLAASFAGYLLWRWISDSERRIRFSADLQAVGVLVVLVIAVSIFLLRWLPVWLTALIALLAIGLTRNLARLTERGLDPARLHDSLAALFMVSGLLLTLAVEFVFLKDYFGTRMNTVFKFYYQGWVLLSIGGAYAAYAIWTRFRSRRGLALVARAVFAAVFVLGIAASLVYTVAAGYSKANRFATRPTLNALSFAQRFNPGEYEAIQWLNAHVEGPPVVLEATGGSYSEFARVSARTGLPTLLGWDFHEQQWRGDRNPAGSRASDIAAIYRGLGDPKSLTLLNGYGISYVFVGGLERTAYGIAQAALDRFGKVAQLVYDKGDVRIYRYFPPQQPTEMPRPE